MNDVVLMFDHDILAVHDHDEYIIAGDHHHHNHHDKVDDDDVVAFTLAKTHEQSQRAAK